LPLLQPSIEKLRGFGSFTKVIGRGRKYESKPIKAFVLSSISKQTGVHIGFAVTRRIRKATQRNLLKRLMREACRIRSEDFLANVESGMLLEIDFLYNGDIKIPSKKVRFASINQALTDLSSTINLVYRQAKT